MPVIVIAQQDVHDDGGGQVVGGRPAFTGPLATLDTPGPVSDIGFEPSIDLIDPDGYAWPLSAFWLTGVAVIGRIAGLGSPPVDLQSLSLPQGGAIVTRVRPQPRTITLGLYIEANSQAAYIAKCDALRKALWNLRLGVSTPAQLRVTRPDGTARQVDVWCVDGPPRSDASSDNDGRIWSIWLLQFAAFDPYFRDSYSQQVTFQLPSGTAGILPLIPIELAPPSILGTVTVNNDGDVFAYPAWTLVGPGKPTLVNQTVNQTLALDVSVPTGRTLTVDTHPDNPVAVLDDGTNYFAHLTSTRALWTLQPGPNLLNLTVATPGGSTVLSLSYARRWLAP